MGRGLKSVKKQLFFCNLVTKCSFGFVVFFTLQFQDQAFVKENIYEILCFYIAIALKLAFYIPMFKIMFKKCSNSSIEKKFNVLK